MSSHTFPCRHRACNMFLESYKAAWILTEDHSFEDRMIDDLSVSWGLPGGVRAEEDGAGARLFVAHLQRSPLALRGRNGSVWLGRNWRGEGARAGCVGREKSPAQQGYREDRRGL